MADQHVLRLHWIDPDRESFALLHVEANGPHPLDLKLVGTDGESVFVGSGKPPNSHQSQFYSLYFLSGIEFWPETSGHYEFLPYHH
jgi:hypothetical protein